MFPQDIVQDTKSPIQLHRTRLRQTETGLGIRPTRCGNRSTDLDSRPALTDGVFQSLVDNPDWHPVLKQRESQYETGGTGTDLSQIRIRSTDDQRIQHATHDKNLWGQLRIDGGEHVWSCERGLVGRDSVDGLELYHPGPFDSAWFTEKSGGV